MSKIIKLEDAVLLQWAHTAPQGELLFGVSIHLDQENPKKIIEDYWKYEAYNPNIPPDCIKPTGRKFDVKINKKLYSEIKKDFSNYMMFYLDPKYRGIVSNAIYYKKNSSKKIKYKLDFYGRVFERIK